MGMARPQLETPEGRDAYRRELRGVAASWRFAGIGLAAIGAVLLGLWRWAGVSTLIPAYVFLVIGGVLMIVAIVKRTRYHQRRISAPASEE